MQKLGGHSALRKEGRRRLREKKTGRKGKMLTMSKLEGCSETGRTGGSRERWGNWLLAGPPGSWERT